MWVVTVLLPDSRSKRYAVLYPVLASKGFFVLSFGFVDGPGWVWQGFYVPTGTNPAHPPSRIRAT